MRYRVLCLTFHFGVCLIKPVRLKNRIPAEFVVASKLYNLPLSLSNETKRFFQILVHISYNTLSISRLVFKSGKQQMQFLMSQGFQKPFNIRTRQAIQSVKTQGSVFCNTRSFQLIVSQKAFLLGYVNTILLALKFRQIHVNILNIMRVFQNFLKLSKFVLVSSYKHDIFQLSRNHLFIFQSNNKYKNIIYMSFIDSYSSPQKPDYISPAKKRIQSLKEIFSSIQQQEQTQTNKNEYQNLQNLYKEIKNNTQFDLEFNNLFNQKIELQDKTEMSHKLVQKIHQLQRKYQQQNEQLKQLSLENQQEIIECFDMQIPTMFDKTENSTIKKIQKLQTKSPQPKSTLSLNQKLQLSDLENRSFHLKYQYKQSQILEDLNRNKGEVKQDQEDYLQYFHQQIGKIKSIQIQNKRKKDQFYQEIKNSLMQVDEILELQLQQEKTIQDNQIQYLIECLKIKLNVI